MPTIAEDLNGWRLGSEAQLKPSLEVEWEHRRLLSKRDQQIGCFCCCGRKINIKKHYFLVYKIIGLSVTFDTTCTSLTFTPVMLLFLVPPPASHLSHVHIYITYM